MERLEPLNVLAFIHDELLLFDDHNHSTPSEITKFLTPYIKRVLRTVIFIISESPDHLLNQLIHRLA